MNETRIRNDDKIQIGTNIKRIRKQKRLKTSDLVIKVQLSGVDINIFVLCKIEANTQHIKASQFRAIAEALEVDCMDLLADYGEGPEER
ncbi:XRE family transcriptional regulator [Clostridium sp. AM58-1XD]|uniref:helix-turn-helix domain-containing protein n=1 Tax=Clostridium sp. AM58-1XD TaxID=2292307 RepID=UPI000E4BF680|nr:XRE family transcriptional regulator [Clostridium sp. AM58-1XD]RGZ00194.1 XRE family transcriptional regulator [Clostridium sp. AM58-1XD]